MLSGMEGTTNMTTMQQLIRSAGSARYVRDLLVACGVDVSIRTVEGWRRGKRVDNPLRRVVYRIITARGVTQ